MCSRSDLTDGAMSYMSAICQELSFIIQSSQVCLAAKADIKAKVSVFDRRPIPDIQRLRNRREYASALIDALVTRILLPASQ